MLCSVTTSVTLSKKRFSSNGILLSSDTTSPRLTCGRSIPSRLWPYSSHYRFLEYEDREVISYTSTPFPGRTREA
ncbi:MAG: hypothetical protein A4E31_00495 [Methanomassiliicoccales archaeon PtaU1.Bin030]|nr:MAG: hypothetical protein A4E31_00495 [Methanomassiliicoccales archaeon PtaU1.Bin030]